MNVRRRDILRAALAATVGPLASVRLPAATLGAGAECARNQRLYLPADDGYLGRLRPRGRPIAIAAGPVGALPRGVTHGPYAYRAHFREHDYRNPTLVFERGERVRIRFDNRLTQPTVVHWHGLTLDTPNDGSGNFVVAAGEQYDYDFEIRNRGGLYWYHPHPHGSTAAQVYGGMYGLLEIEDDDNARLRHALDLVPGTTEWTLVMQDRRPGPYAPSEHDRTHGYLGNEMYINGAACGTREVANRIYRLRILNACNARTLRLAFRTRDGASLPFYLIGTDCGLLGKPLRCEEAFLASAERLDLLLDLRDAGKGDTIMLESLGFDPMHGEGQEAPAAPEPAAHDHAAATDNADHAAMGHDHAAMAHDHAAMVAGASRSGWPEGTARAMLELRVGRKTSYERDLPHALSTVPQIATEGARERPFRLTYHKGRWSINDRTFVMGETPIEVARGTREVWLLRNYYTSMPHAMHLHGFQFDVLERETSPDQVKPLVVDDHGRLASDLGRKDTILVWPGESVRIAIDFSIPFPGPQTYVFHCHNLEHEDAGMMLGVKVT